MGTRLSSSIGEIAYICTAARKMSAGSSMARRKQPKPAWPSHWIPGQLLDLKRFTDGTYRATLLGEEWNPEAVNGMEFSSSQDAQQFVSKWYARQV